MTADQTLTLAAQFRAAITAADPERIRAVLSPDCVIWYNQFGAEQTMTREQAIQTIMGMQAFVRDFRYTDVRVEPTASGYVQQSVIRCRTAGGVEMAVAVCLIARVDGGRIVRYDEYRDSAQTAPLMAEVQAAQQRASA